MLGYTPAPDAIQEFNLITNNAPAEFGNFEGGIVNATIKSGTNAFHGDVWEFFRNDVLNANSWQNNLHRNELGMGSSPKSKLRWNMFGGTLGGPIIKNKLFFFADYQAQRFDIPQSSTANTVFTAAERAGDFGAFVLRNGGSFTGPDGTARGNRGSVIQPLRISSVPRVLPFAAATTRQPFPNNQIPPAMISPVAAKLFASSSLSAPTNGASCKTMPYILKLRT